MAELGGQARREGSLRARKRGSVTREVKDSWAPGAPWRTRETPLD